MRTQPVGETDWHAPPGLDEKAVFGVGGVILRNTVALVEAVFVMQWLRFEPPVLFEGEGSGSAFAAAVVEDLDAVFATAAHQFPVLEIVGGQMARAFIVAGVVGKHFVAEIERQHAAQEAAIGIGNGENFTVVAKDLQEGIEIAFR